MQRAEEKQSLWIVTCASSAEAGFFLRNVIPKGMVEGERERGGVGSHGCASQDMCWARKSTPFCRPIKSSENAVGASLQYI